MNQQGWIILIACTAAVVLVALIFGRRLSIKAGDKSIETGAVQPPPRSMSISAAGPKSRVRNVRQTSRGGLSHMNIKAEAGGNIERARQDDAKPK